MFRRILILMTMLIGGIVVLSPQTASAHHPEVSGSAVCNDDGTWTITWSVRPWANQPNYDWKISSSNADLYSPQGRQQALATSRFTRTQTLPPTDNVERETVAAKWYDGGRYVAGGERTSDKVHKPSGCGWNWTYPAPDCSALTVTYPEWLPSGQANDVNVRIENLDNPGEQVTLNFHNDDGDWTGTQVFEYASHPNWPGWTHFRVEWTQVAGTNDHWEGEVPCGQPTSTTTSTTTSTSPTTTTSTSPTTTTTTAPPTTTTTSTTTTTAPTTTTTTTSTTTSTTTTTQPCVWNPQLPADSQECSPPQVTIDAICTEVTATDEFETYWYRIRNDGDVAVTVTWAGGSADIEPGSSEIVAADENGLAISVNGEVVATADSLDTGSTDPASNDDICQIDVEFSKDVEGPGPGADTRYTIKVSRLNVDGDVAEFEEEITFDLLDNESKVVPLPSTFNPLGIEYRIEEIADGGASASAVNPNSFVLDGHRGETISVVVINSFASVEIDKYSSATTVFEGDELNYTLDVVNTGALTLEPVVVDDRLPAGVSYVDYEIEDDAGTCTLTEAARPQLVTCTFADPLAPGAQAPRITLLVEIDSIDVGEQIVNQARVRGTYDAPEVRGNAVFLDDEAAGLACEPTEGEVCDLSPRAGVTGGSPTTTTTASGGPTTTIVGSDAATTTIAAELPPTGSNGPGTMVWIGTMLLGAGTAISLLVRRRTV